MLGHDALGLVVLLRHVELLGKLHLVNITLDGILVVDTHVVELVGVVLLVLEHLVVFHLELLLLLGGLLVVRLLDLLGLALHHLTNLIILTLLVGLTLAHCMLGLVVVIDHNGALLTVLRLLLLNLDLLLVGVALLLHHLVEELVLDVGLLLHHGLLVHHLTAIVGKHSTRRKLVLLIVILLRVAHLRLVVALQVDDALVLAWLLLEHLILLLAHVGVQEHLLVLVHLLLHHGVALELFVLLEALVVLIHHVHHLAAIVIAAALNVSYHDVVAAHSLALLELVLLVEHLAA